MANLSVRSRSGRVSFISNRRYRMIDLKRSRGIVPRISSGPYFVETMFVTDMFFKPNAPRAYTTAMKALSSINDIDQSVFPIERCASVSVHLRMYSRSSSSIIDVNAVEMLLILLLAKGVGPGIILIILCAEALPTRLEVESETVVFNQIVPSAAVSLSLSSFSFSSASLSISESSESSELCVSSANFESYKGNINTKCKQQTHLSSHFPLLEFRLYLTRHQNHLSIRDLHFSTLLIFQQFVSNYISYYIATF